MFLLQWHNAQALSHNTASLLLAGAHSSLHRATTACTGQVVLWLMHDCVLCYIRAGRASIQLHPFTE
jgi:hypothetical protein